MDEEESFTLSLLESAVVFFNSGVFIGLSYDLLFVSTHSDLGLMLRR